MKILTFFDKNTDMFDEITDIESWHWVLLTYSESYNAIYIMIIAIKVSTLPQ